MSTDLHLSAQSTQKYSIPLTHLEYDYIGKCKDVKELEKILRVLRSGDEGRYPDLETFAEKCIEKINPKSRALRKDTPISKMGDLGQGDWKEIDQDFKDWTTNMNSRDDLKAGKVVTKSQIDLYEEDENLPPVRSSNVKLEGAQRKEVNPEKKKRAMPRDYKEWDKVDIDAELENIDKTEKDKTVSARTSSVKGITEKIDAKGMSDEEKDRKANREKDKGNEAYRSGDYEESVTYYSRSISLMPISASYNNRALAYLKMEKWDKAIKDCNTVLKREKDNVKALLRRGTAFKSKNQLSKSKVDFEKVLEMEPNNKKAETLLEEVKEKEEADNKTRKEKGRRMVIEEVEESEEEEEIEVEKPVVNGVGHEHPPKENGFHHEENNADSSTEMEKRNNKENNLRSSDSSSYSKIDDEKSSKKSEKKKGQNSSEKKLPPSSSSSSNSKGSNDNTSKNKQPSACSPKEKTSTQSSSSSSTSTSSANLPAPPNDKKNAALQKDDVKKKQPQQANHKTAPVQKQTSSSQASQATSQSQQPTTCSAPNTTPTSSSSTPLSSSSPSSAKTQPVVSSTTSKSTKAIPSSPPTDETNLPSPTTTAATTTASVTDSSGSSSDNSSISFTRPVFVHHPLPVKVSKLKEEANNAFRNGQYDGALNIYSQAIALLEKEKETDQTVNISLLLSNSAACNLKTGCISQAVKDCHKSLSLIPHSLKSLLRRAAAFETLEIYGKAYVDYKHVLSIDRCVDQASQGASRCQKMLQDIHGQRLWREKIPPLVLVQPWEVPQIVDPNSQHTHTTASTTTTSSTSPSQPTISAPAKPSNTTESSNLKSSEITTASTKTEKKEESKKVEPPTPSKQEQFEKLKASGNKHVQKGEYSEAEKCYSSCIALCPEQVACYTNRALCYIKLNKAQEAECDCNKALALQVDNPKAMYRRALARKMLQKYKLSMQDLLELMKLEPKNKAAISEMEIVKQYYKEELEQLKQKKAENDGKVRKRMKIEEVDEEEEEEKTNRGGKNQTKSQTKSRSGKSSQSPSSVKSKSSSASTDSHHNHHQTSKTSKAARDTPTPSAVNPSMPVAPPSAPRLMKTTPYEFCQAWNSLKPNQGIQPYAEILRQISPSDLPSVISNKLDGQMLQIIVRCVYEEMVLKGEVDKGYQILDNLCQVPRFSTVSMFLSSKEKKEVSSVLDILGKGGSSAYSKSDVLRLKKEYSVK